MPTYPLAFPIFQPAMRLITAIQRGAITTVTTSPNHQYVSGTIVRFHIYPANGMPQLNQMTGAITVTGVNTFTVPIDSTNFDPFVVPAMPTANNTEACVVPIGEVNELLKAAVQNILPF